MAKNKNAEVFVESISAIDGTEMNPDVLKIVYTDAFNIFEAIENGESVIRDFESFIQSGKLSNTIEWTEENFIEMYMMLGFLCGVRLSGEQVKKLMDMLLEKGIEQNSNEFIYLQKVHAHLASIVYEPARRVYHTRKRINEKDSLLFMLYSAIIDIKKTNYRTRLDVGKIRNSIDRVMNTGNRYSGGDRQHNTYTKREEKPIDIDGFFDE